MGLDSGLEHSVQLNHAQVVQQPFQIVYRKLKPIIPAVAQDVVAAINVEFAVDKRFQPEQHGMVGRWRSGARLRFIQIQDTLSEPERDTNGIVRPRSAVLGLKSSIKQERGDRVTQPLVELGAAALLLHEQLEVGV